MFLIYSIYILDGFFLLLLLVHADFFAGFFFLLWFCCVAGVRMVCVRVFAFDMSPNMHAMHMANVRPKRRQKDKACVVWCFVWYSSFCGYSFVRCLLILLFWSPLFHADFALLLNFIADSTQTHISQTRKSTHCTGASCSCRVYVPRPPAPSLHGFLFLVGIAYLL